LLVGEPDTGEQSSTAEGSSRDQISNLLQTGLELRPALTHGLGEAVVGPELAQGSGGGDEGRVEAAEGAVVFARLPLVQLGTDQGDGHRQAKTGDRLRQTDDIRGDAGGLEREERTGTAAACLYVVDDQQHLIAAAQIGQVAQPLHPASIETALALNGLDDHGGRKVLS